MRESEVRRHSPASLLVGNSHLGQTHDEEEDGGDEVEELHVGEGVGGI
jgi:hypothetical protein